MAFGFAGADRVAEPKRRDWTTDEFLAWEAAQPIRYELVEGRPAMMAGGTQAHDAIAVNLTSTLRALLRGSGCRPGTSDLRVPTGTGNVRYPDVTVDCGEFRCESHDASQPTVVFEILSRSTAWTDLHRKLHDYDMTPTIAQYVLVAQDEPRVELWNRGANGRLALEASIVDRDGVVELRSIGVTLGMAEVYEGLGFWSEGSGVVADEA
jgi:Uma2 family endonuclease